MAFRVGDKVIYPNQGVGVIEEVSTHNIAGRDEEFYMLRLSASNSTVMVPVANVNNVGLRKLCSAKELETLFDILRGNFSEPDPDWKNRYKKNVEKMKTGSIFEVVKVLKNLYFLSFQKSLSFREKKMFDRAKQLVVTEIATVHDDPVDKVGSLVEELLLATYNREHAEVSSEG